MIEPNLKIQILQMDRERVIEKYNQAGEEMQKWKERRIKLGKQLQQIEKKMGE